MQQKRKFDLNILLIILVSGILRIIPFFRHAKHLLRVDDFGPLIYPAYVAGYDWSSYVKGMNHYYGFGYYWIMAPLFRLTSSPEALLIGIQVVNSITLILIALLIYHLLISYFNLKRSWTTAVIAILPSLLSGAIYGRSKLWFHTDNEIPLLLAVWLSVWAVLAAERAMTKGLKSRIFHAVVVALVLTWALSVHERAMALFIAVMFAEVLLFLMKRKWLLQPVAFFGSMAAGYYLQRMMRHMVISTMWQGGWPGKNTDAFRGVGLWFLKSKDAMIAFLMTLFGNIHAVIVKGFGITGIAIVLLVVWLVWNIVPKLKAKLPKQEQDWIDREMLVILIFGICVAITVAGLCMRWGIKLVDGLSDYTNFKGFKGICYGRYYQSYLSPVVLAVMVWIYRRKPTSSARTVAEGWWGVYAAVEIIFFSLIYPHLMVLKHVTGVSYFNRAFGLRVFNGHGAGFYAILTMVITTVTMTLMTVAAVRGDRAVCRIKKCTLTGRHFVVLTALFLLALFGIDRLDEVETLHPTLELVDVQGMDEVFSELDEKDVLPDNLYLFPTNWNYVLVLDNKDKEFQALGPAADQIAEDNLVITTAQQDAYPLAGYSAYQVGSHWIYTNVEETARALDDCELAVPYDAASANPDGLDTSSIDAAIIAEQEAAHAQEQLDEEEEAA